MMLLFRNWLRRHNWIKIDDHEKLVRDNFETKISEWRKRKALERIAREAEGCSCPHCKRLRKLAMNALNLREE